MKRYQVDFEIKAIKSITIAAESRSDARNIAHDILRNTTDDEFERIVGITGFAPPASTQGWVIDTLNDHGERVLSFLNADGTVTPYPKDGQATPTTHKDLARHAKRVGL